MAVGAKIVKELRDKTGAPILDCRDALEKNNSDMEKAIVYLREKGIASASKRQGRDTKDGRIAFYMHPGNKLGVMVEVNCETDFVAKGPEFTEFSKDIAMHIAAASPLYLKREDVPEDILEKERQIYKTQAVNSKKPEKIIDKIVEGKLEKYYSAICLMEQNFIKDDKLTIRSFIDSSISKFGENISIGRFSRFKLGDAA